MTTCRNCGSNNVYQSTTATKIGGTIGAGAGAIGGYAGATSGAAAVDKYIFNHRCRDCGCEF